MKTWEEMSNRERAEQTIKDIKRRQALREKGKQDAVNYGFEQAIKAKARKSKIKYRSYRGV